MVPKNNINYFQAIVKTFFAFSLKIVLRFENFGCKKRLQLRKASITYHVTLNILHNVECICLEYVTQKGIFSQECSGGPPNSAFCVVIIESVCLLVYQNCGADLKKLVSEKEACLDFLLPQNCTSHCFTSNISQKMKN